MQSEIRVLITGASSGIGRALAIRLVEHYNAKIIAIGRREKLLLSLQEKFPERIIPIPADVSKVADRENIINTVKNMKPLTHVVNNAGIIEPITPIKDLALEDFRYQFVVNTEAPLFLTRDLIPLLAENARVLFTSSGAAYRVEKGLGSYCISKTALEVVYQILKLEFSAQPVYFASLRPGGVDTHMVDVATKIPTEICEFAEISRQRKAEKSLLTPEQSAEFMEWVLLHTKNSEYERHWNINDPNLKNWQNSRGKNLASS